MDDKYVLVYLASGALDAQTIKLFLESQGLHPLILQESAGMTYGLTVGPMGTAQLFVLKEEEETARKLLKEMDEGDFVDNDMDTSELDMMDDDHPEA